ncbi:hypothetical protein C8R44DRAFT_804177, partial [Mycena epipterygia]
MESLVGSAARWRRVALSRFASEAGLQALTAVAAPILQDVEIACYRMDKPLSWKLLESPSLRSVSLKAGVGLGRFILDMPLGWADLTHLSLECDGSSSHGLPLFTVFTVLKRSPQLVSFRCSMSDEGEESMFDGPVLVPFLRNFTILAPCNVMPNRIGRLMDQLIMPQLRNFELPRRYPGLRQTQTHTGFLATLAAASPLLTTLKIDMGCFTEAALFDALHRLSSLTKLVVTDAPVAESADTEQLLTALTPASTATQQSTPCPLLEDLQIHGCRMLGDELLLTFIQRRIGTLQRLSIEYECSKPRLIYSRFVNAGWRSRCIAVH